MLKHLCFLFFSLLLIGCKEKNSKAVVDEFADREINESYQSVSLQDTAMATLKKVTIKDPLYKPAIEREVVDFYKKYNYQTRWLYQNKPSPLFTSYIQVLTALSDYGFFPENYRQKELSQKVDSLYKGRLSLTDLEETDREITASFLLFTRHLTRGRVPKVGDEKRVWKRTRPLLDNVELLLKLKDNDNLSQIIEALQPQQPFYKAMAQRYRELEKDTAEVLTPFAITDLKSYTIGYADSTILALRACLKHKGYESLYRKILNRWIHYWWKQ